MRFLPEIQEVGRAKEIDLQDVQEFLQLAQENHFGKIVAHAPYTMNCAGSEGESERFCQRDNGR